MNHKLVVFTYSGDLLLTEYLTKQCEAIVNSIPELPIELVNELDDRLVLYSNKPNRFPCFMLFKNDVMKTYIHSKMGDEDIINWVVNKIG